MLCCRSFDAPTSLPTLICTLYRFSFSFTSDTPADIYTLQLLFFFACTRSWLWAPANFTLCCHLLNGSSTLSAFFHRSYNLSVYIVLLLCSYKYSFLHSTLFFPLHLAQIYSVRLLSSCNSTSLSLEFISYFCLRRRSGREQNVTACMRESEILSVFHSCFFFFAHCEL